MKKRPTDTQIRDALTKVTIGKGGKFSRRSIGAGWEISFEERDPRVDHPDVLAVLTIRTPPELAWSHGRRTTRAALGAESVYTKSKSGWRRDCVWRLRPEVIDRWTEAARKAIDAAVLR